MKLPEKVRLFFEFVGLIVAIVGIWLIYQQIKESNRLAQLGSLNGRAAELQKLGIEHPELLCIYKYPLEKKENEFCVKVLQNRDGYFKLYEYTQQIIFLIEEDYQYSIDFKQDDIQSYAYWIETIKDDNEGIFSHVMYDLIKYDEKNKNTKYPGLAALFGVDATSIKAKNDAFMKKYGRDN